MDFKTSESLLDSYSYIRISHDSAYTQHNSNIIIMLIITQLCMYSYYQNCYSGINVDS